MFETIKFKLTTHIQGKDISSPENFANWCLRPAAYFFNGKKIDLICYGDNIAVQKADVYKPTDKKWYKTALMVVLFIPGTILGGAIKLFTPDTFLTPACRHEIFIKKCLNPELTGQVLTPKGQGKFGKDIKKLIDTLLLSNAHLNKQTPLFLSEVTKVDLLFEEHEKVQDKYQAKTQHEAKKETNKIILDNVEHLWNLSTINLADHYVNADVGLERSALRRINPKIITFNIEKNEFNKAIPARQKFADTSPSKLLKKEAFGIL